MLISINVFTEKISIRGRD